MQVSYKKRKKKENSKITTFRKIKKNQNPELLQIYYLKCPTVKILKFFLKKEEKKKENVRHTDNRKS